jgi:hypothetical protein
MIRWKRNIECSGIKNSNVVQAFLPVVLSDVCISINLSNYILTGYNFWKCYTYILLSNPHGKGTYRDEKTYAVHAFEFGHTGFLYVTPHRFQTDLYMSIMGHYNHFLQQKKILCPPQLYLQISYKIVTYSNKSCSYFTNGYSYKRASRLHNERSPCCF